MFPLPSKHIHEDHQPTDTQPASTAETPFRRKKAFEGAYQQSKHEDKKKIVCTDIGPYLRTVPYSHFFDHILPDLLPSHKPEDIVKKLKANGAIKYKRFASFPRNPMKYAAIENVVFQRLETLVDGIVAVASSQRIQPTMRFVCNPDGAPESSSRTNLSRPDCYALLDSASGTVKWVDIGVTGEFKKCAAPTFKQDNEEKVAWSMHHCLCEDPRRRFNISFSVENDAMRLWFCNRQEVLVSTSFKFITNHRLTAHFFLSVMFADPYELGWDPTMTPVGDGQYDITVRVQPGERVTYRTLSKLSDVGADAALGRGTRVWMVKRVVQGRLEGPPLTLKDIWIDDDRHREADIYRELRKAAATDYQKAIFERLLLEVECHGDVFIEEEGRYDHTVELPFRGAVIPESAPRSLLRLFSRKNSQNAEGFWVAGRSVPSREAKSHPKLHYRVVLRGVHRALYKLKDPYEVFYALGATALALRAMHEVGWVHRDINPGNVLVRYIETEAGKEMAVKLIDLEYAKPFDNDTSHPARSGMRGFTPVEVETSQYRFTSTQGKPELPPQSPSPTLGQFFGGATKGISLKKTTPARSAPPTPPTVASSSQFRYNPLHDLESLWWTAAYFCLHYEISLEGVLYPATTTQRDEARRIFCDSSFDRFTVLDTTTSFKKAVDSLHPSMQAAGATLEQLRDMLCRFYRQAEQNTSTIDCTVADGLYEFFAAQLREIAMRYQRSDVILNRINFEDEKGVNVGKNKKTLKRRQSDLSNDTVSQDDANPRTTSDGFGDGPASRTRSHFKRARATN